MQLSGHKLNRPATPGTDKPRIIRVIRSDDQQQADAVRETVRGKGPECKAALAGLLTKAVAHYKLDLEDKDVVDQLCAQEEGKGGDLVPSLREAVGALEAILRGFLDHKKGMTGRREDVWNGRPGERVVSQATGQGDFWIGGVKVDIKSPGNLSKELPKRENLFRKEKAGKEQQLAKHGLDLTYSAEVVASKVKSKPNLIEVVDTSLLTNAERKIYMDRLEALLKSDSERCRVIEVSVPLYPGDQPRYQITPANVRVASAPLASASGAEEDGDTFSGLFGTSED
jgi:hypothetical protein